MITSVRQDGAPTAGGSRNRSDATDGGWHCFGHHWMMIFAVDRTKRTEKKKKARIVAAAAAGVVVAGRFVRRADCSAAVEM